MEIAFEKGIEIPPIARRANRGLTAALRTMEIGDSFTLPITNGRKNCATGAYYAAKQSGFKLTARKISDEEIRFWRIA